VTQFNESLDMYYRVDFDLTGSNISNLYVYWRNLS